MRVAGKDLARRVEGQPAVVLLLVRIGWRESIVNIIRTQRAENLDKCCYWEGSGSRLFPHLGILDAVSCVFWAARVWP